MKLFIANCSRQKHLFNYKLPERTQPYCLPIRPGEQGMIDNNSDVINMIIKQHEPYGLLPASKLDKSFSGICYSIDREVTLNSFRDGHDQKTENLENFSKDVLAASALALDATVDREVMKTGEVSAPNEDGVQLEIIGEPLNPEQENPPSFKTTVKVKKG